MIDKINQLTWFVDGSYMPSVNPDVTGWGCFCVETRETFSGVLIDPELVSMRQIGGECKSAMMALKYSIDLDASSIIIHYDYTGVADWALGTWKAKKKFTMMYAVYMREHMRQNVFDVTLPAVAFIHAPSKESEMQLRADLLAKAAIKDYTDTGVVNYSGKY